MIKTLVEMLNVGSEKEQQAETGGLIKLSSQSSTKALAIVDAEVNATKSLYMILLPPRSLRVKGRYCIAL